MDLCGLINVWQVTSTLNMHEATYTHELFTEMKHTIIKVHIYLQIK